MARGLRLDRFVGLRNKEDPLRRIAKEGEVGLGAADNVYVDDELKLAIGEGFTSVSAGTFEDIITTQDELRGYVVGGGALSVINDDLTLSTIEAGLPAGAALDWAEANERIYLLIGDQARVIFPDHSIRDWGIARPDPITLTAAAGTHPAGTYLATVTHLAPDGRESGAPAPARLELSAAGGLLIENIPQVAGLTTAVYLSQPDGNTLYLALTTGQTTVAYPNPVLDLNVPLASLHFDRPPSGELVEHHQGRMHIARRDKARNVTIVYRSEALAFEWFDVMRARAVPGLVQMMASVEGGLLCVTDSTVVLLTDDDGFVKLADYGSPTGKSDVMHNKQCYFWTERGLCRAMPFENLTESIVSLPPGENASGVVLELGGVEKYVVLLDDAESARNAY